MSRSNPVKKGFGTFFAGLFLAIISIGCLFAPVVEGAINFAPTDSEKSALAFMREKPIRIAYSYDLVYRQLPDGSHVGMLAPLLDVLQKELGLKVEMRKLDWDAAFNAIENGGVDFYGLIGLTEARRQQYHTINPMFRADAQIVTRTNDPLGSLLNLRNKKIGLLKRSIISRQLFTYLYPNGKIVYYPTIPAMIDGLEKREIDCFATPDNAEEEILCRQAMRYEFTIQNFYVDQGFISMRDEVKPLADILNRYLASAAGGKLVTAIEDARREELFRWERARFAKEIVAIQERYDTVEAYDSGVLYPVSFFEKNERKGMQIEINDLFKNLTGVSVEIQELNYLQNGVDTALARVRSGDCQFITGMYPNIELWNDEAFDYSIPIWTDSIRAYAYGTSDVDMRHCRIGTTMSDVNYVHWDLVAGGRPAIYESRQALIHALKKGEIDVAFVSEMAFNYHYTILEDYNLKELGSTMAVTNLQMLYGTQNPELNFLMDESIRLYQAMYPQARIQWQEKAEKYKSDYIRVRDAQNAFFYRAAVIFAVIGTMTLLILFLLHRYATYDRQIRKLIQKQQTFDLIWGNLKTKRLVSKGDHPFFRKWGLSLKNASCSMEELSRALGWDVYDDYLSDLENMEKEDTDFIITEKEVISPKDGQSRYYRRYLHRLGKHAIMSSIQDVTEERTKVDALTYVASTDFLSTLLTRRAMNDLLVRKCEEFQKNGSHAFLIMYDIDDFKKINDSYGHDIGDEVLKTVARIIQDTALCECSTSRWGGEEFLTLLECEDIERVSETAHHILRTVADHPMKVRGSEKSFRVTVSAGVAELDCRNYAGSVQHADKALYDAKNCGKNCMRIWKDPDQ